MAAGDLSERRGSVPAVRAFQRILNERAEPLFHPPLSDDGQFGPNTRFAYRSLAWAHGLSLEDVELAVIPLRVQEKLADPTTRTATQKRVARIRAPKIHLHTVAMDGAPLHWGLAKPLVRARGHGWGGRLSSGDRRTGVAEQFGKKSQHTLYDCYQDRLRTGRCPVKCSGECNPANRPGRSSHELRSDGTRSFSTHAVGGRLKWWELGLDVSDSTGLLRHLKALRYEAHRTYPNSPQERHHINFTADPGRVKPPDGPNA